MDSPIFPSPALDRRAWPMGGQLDYWHASDGWPIRRYRLGAGTRGRMLLLNGRGDMIEKYLEVIHHWAQRGWAVTSFDWRGQGGSGRLTDDPLCGHIDDFTQWMGDLRALSSDWRANGSGPTVMLGHSMGGHMLLRALAEGLAEPDAAVAVAPMLGLHTAPLPRWLAVAIASFMCAIGRGEKRAWTQKEESDRQRQMRQKRLTHDPDRYADEIWWRDHSRDIALGPPSWNWVRLALEFNSRIGGGKRAGANRGADPVPGRLSRSTGRDTGDPADRGALARCPPACLWARGRA
ncbi:Lysophospholipase OS=Sphingobium scionense OX=1404341 GN=GGQ90_001720 PE=4 SV=1 [Sphingobium scionense]